MSSHKDAHSVQALSRVDKKHSEPALLSAELLDDLRPDATLALPKVRQLYLNLYNAIERGTLLYGVQLPSSRSMAVALGLGRNTVISVYEQLAAEGLLSANGRGGTRVERRVTSSFRDDSESEWATSNRSNIDNYQQSVHREFASGEPDTTLFPQATWRKALTTAAQLTAAQIGYRAQPLSITQQAIARYLATYRSLIVDPVQIVVTSSTRQSLMLAAALYCDHGDVVWVECPGYSGAVEAFQQLGLTLLPCQVDSQGLVPPKNLNTPPRLVYLTPCFQYPFGMPLGAVRRDSLLDLSRQFGSVLFEDDYDSEFRDGTQPRPALAAEAKGAHVLHAGTFSKLLFPAVRVGWMVVPKQSVTAAHRCLKAIGGGNNTIMQAAVTELLDNGSIIRHLRRARQVYGQRRRALIDALGGCEYLRPVDEVSGSLSLVLHLNQSVSIDELQMALNHNKLGAKPLEHFAWNIRKPTRCKALVLGLGNVETLAIPRTVDRLINVLGSVSST